MIRLLVVAPLIFTALACFVLAWRSNARWTRELNRWGVVYGCRRWPQETNQNYYVRLRARRGYP